MDGSAVSEHVRVVGEPSFVAPDDSGRISGRQRRLVLSLLVAARPRARSREELAQAIWGDDRPATADKTIQTHVSQLRRHLATLTVDGGILSTDGGYRLSPTCIVDVDAIRGRGTDRPLDELLAERVLHHRPYTGFEDVDDPILRADVLRTTQLQLRLLIAAADRAVSTGRPDDLLGLLERAGQDHPYDEPLWCALARVQLAGGQQARALATLASCRRRLADDLGVDAGTDLRTLETRILRQDPTLTGWAAVLPPTPPLPRRLRPLGHFVGRELEVSDLRRHWRAPGLVTVVGAPGVGAARLVAEVIEQVDDPRPLWAVDVGGLPPDALAAAVGTAREHTETHGGVLVLVDADRHRDEARAVVRSLVATTALTIVVTARRALGLSTESVIRLGALHPDAARSLLLAGLDAEAQPSARQLDLLLAATERHAGAIAVVTERLRARPVADVVAAVRGGVSGLDHDAAAWAATQVTRGVSRLSDRARTVVALLALMPDGITPEDLMAIGGRAVGERIDEVVACNLARLVQIDDTETRYRLAVPVHGQAADLLPQDPSLALRRRWIDRVSRRVGDGARPADLRHDWNNVVRAVDWVLEAGLAREEEGFVLAAARAAVRVGDAEHGRGWPERLLPTCATSLSRARALVAMADGALVTKDLVGMRTYLERAAALGVTDQFTVDRIVVGLADSDRVVGDAASGLARLEAHDPGAEPDTVVLFATRRAQLLYRQARLPEARVQAERAVAGARRRRADPALLVDALAIEAVIALAQQDHPRSRGAIDEAIERARDTGLLGRLPSLLGTSGNIAVGEDEPSRASEDITEALATTRQLGDPVTEGITLANLANVRQLLGDAAGAVRRLEQALEVMLEHGAAPQVVQVQLNLADAVLVARGDARRARDLALDATASTRRADSADLAWCLEVLARALHASSEHPLAARTLGAAAARRARIGRPPQARLRQALDRVRDDLASELGPAFDGELDIGSRASLDDLLGAAVR